MTRITSLGSLIHHMVLFCRVCRVRDPSFLIEDADLLNAGFGCHRLNRAIQSFPIIPQHVIGGALLDDVADTLGLEQRVPLKVLAVKSNVQVPQQGEDQNHCAEQKYVELGAQCLRCPQKAGPGWFSSRHAPAPAPLSAWRIARLLLSVRPGRPWGRSANTCTATRNKAKPSAMIIRVTENSVHLGT